MAQGYRAGRKSPGEEGAQPPHRTWERALGGLLKLWLRRK